MPEFVALIERAVRAGERSDSLALDSVRLRSLTQQLRAAWAGDALLVRCAWCRRFKIGDEWLYLDAVGEREQQIAARLLATCSHGICPGCFEEQTAPRR
jgi:hypothetical protein